MNRTPHPACQTPTVAAPIRSRRDMEAAPSAPSSNGIRLLTSAATLLILLTCSLLPALAADPPEKGKESSANAELLAAAAPPAITLPRATRKDNPSTGPSRPAAIPSPARKGVHVSARVVANGKDHQMHANSVGNYRRIEVRPKEKSSVDLAFPGGREGDVVIVSAMDGGRVNGKSGGNKLTLDKAGRISFDFEVNEERGIYRLLVRRGQDSKVMEFWAGEALPLNTRVTARKEAGK